MRIMQFKHHRLDNGLDIIAEVDPAAHTAAVGYFVKTGARDETPDVMGVSHFLEHMMFKGTDRRSADDVNREFDEIGANYNAFTSHEQTVYYAHVLPEFLPRAVDLLSDMLRPALRKSDFDMEKNVILEEIGMYDDKPQWRLQDSLLEAYFRGHPLGFRVLGTRDTVGALTDSQMRDYFQGRYSSDNIVVAASGNLDFNRLVDEVGTLTAKWAPTQASRRYDTPQLAEDVLALRDEKVTRHYIAALMPAPSAQDHDRYAMKVLSDVLGDSDGSRLYWALIDPGLADEAEFSFSPQDRIGYSIAYASCDPDRAEEVQAKLLDVIDHVGDDLNEGEVERAKNKLATNATLTGERPSGRMMSLGATWSYLGVYLPLEEELAKLLAVTVDDLRAVLRKYPMRPRTVMSLGQK